MDKAFIYDFIVQRKLAAVSSLSRDNKPQSALVGIAVSEDLEIIFDTVNSSRKYENLTRNPNVSIVIGWDNETTVQYEGTAMELSGKDADRYKEIYFEAYPDGRDRAVNWPGLVHFVVKPIWVRYSNFNEPVKIEEMRF